MCVKIFSLYLLTDAAEKNCNIFVGYKLYQNIETLSDRVDWKKFAQQFS